MTDSDSGYSFENPPAGEPPANADEPLQAVLSEVSSLKEQVSAHERQQQDLARFLAGRQEAQPDIETLKQREIEALAQDPLAYKQGIVNQALSQLTEQMTTQRILEESRKKHSDLLPFEGVVYGEAQAIYVAAMQANKPISESEAIDKAAEIVREKIRAAASSSASPSQAQALQTEALKLSPMGTKPPAQNVDVSKMSSSEFREYDRQIRARFKSPY